MCTNVLRASAIVLVLAMSTDGEEATKSNAIEVELLKTYIGVWDADIEVWPAGLDSPSTRFKGVETNRAYGEYWIASDFDSEYMGQVMKVHSIVGYDLDTKKFVGKVIDHGPYAATMTGDYDEETQTVTWMTKVKDANGKPIVQRTQVTNQENGERVLILMVPDKEKDSFVKFMQIKFVKRK